MRRSAVLVLAIVAGLSLGAGPAAVEVNLEEVAHSALGAGPWEDVAVAGRTAIVREQSHGCGTKAPVLVDLADPRHLRPAADLPLPTGMTVVDMAAVAAATPAFTGDLLAVAFDSCSAGPPGVLYYDVTKAAEPRLLSRMDREDPAAVALAVRTDGRVVSALVSTGYGAASPTVVIDDVTDPVRPATVARWVRPANDESSAGGCGPVSSGVTLAETGDRAVAVFGDGGIYDLDLADPSRVGLVGHAAASAGRPAAAAVLPVGRRTLAVVSEDDLACGEYPPAGRGLRLLALDRQSAPSEAGELRLPSLVAPGRLVASGELAFVAWHADGLRVVDLGQVTPKVVAQFIPAGPGEVLGVALTPDYVLIAVRSSGLYVLKRPDEGNRESLAQKIKNAAGFMIFPVAAGLLLTVPRLAMGHQGAGSRSESPSPVRARVPRRR